jgi:hypothetical protein
MPLAGIFWHGLLDEKRVNCITFAGGPKNAINFMFRREIGCLPIRTFGIWRE